MSSVIKGQSISKEDFSRYFREVEPVQGNEKPTFEQNVLTLEDIATNDEESYKNYRNLLEGTGVTQEQLKRLDIDRENKREELGLITKTEKRN